MKVLDFATAFHGRKPRRNHETAKGCSEVLIVFPILRTRRPSTSLPLIYSDAGWQDWPRNEGDANGQSF